MVVTADHGPLLGENDRVGHALSLDEAVLQIPLIVFDPRSARPARVRTRVGRVDLLPTLLELADASVPIEIAPDRAGLDGRSLVPARRGERLPTQPYVSEVQDQSVARDDPDLTEVAIYRADLKVVQGREGTSV